MVPTAVEAEELDDMRVTFRTLVVSGFVAQASPSQVRAVHRFADLCRAGAAPAELFAAKEWIYGLLVRGGGNASVIPMLARARGRVSLVTTAALARPGGAEITAAEITAADFAVILAAAEARDAATAVRICRTHLRRTREAGLLALAAGA